MELFIMQDAGFPGALVCRKDLWQTTGIAHCIEPIYLPF